MTYARRMAHNDKTFDIRVSWLQSRLTAIFPGCCAAWLGVRVAGVIGRILDWKPIALVIADSLLGALTLTIAGALAVASLTSRLAQTSRTAWTLGAAISTTFLLFDLGKLLHPDDMVAFFQASGWPGWLHWAVLTAEVISALTVIRHAPYWPGAASAAVLLAIMAGAVFTHLRNADPLDAISDAVRQALLLISYLALHPLLRGWPRRQTFTVAGRDAAATGRHLDG